jgi:hypothetical protein
MPVCEKCKVESEPSMYDHAGRPYDIRNLIRLAGQCSDGRCKCWLKGSLVRHCPKCDHLYLGDGVRQCVECKDTRVG